MLTRPKNIMFAGADVDTAKIHFQNINELGGNNYSLDSVASIKSGSVNVTYMF